MMKSEQLYFCVQFPQIQSSDATPHSPEGARLSISLQSVLSEERKHTSELDIM